MINKKEITDEIIQILKPSIKKALFQTPFDHRDDLEQELYLKIVKKISKEDMDNFPGFFEVLQFAKGKGAYDEDPFNHLRKS